jgi:hypothetical protein
MPVTGVAAHHLTVTTAFALGLDNLADEFTQKPTKLGQNAAMVSSLEG